MAQKAIIIKDEEQLKEFLKEDNAREMTANDLKVKLAQIYSGKTGMLESITEYNKIVRKVDLTEEDEKRLENLEVRFEFLNEDYAHFAKWHHYATILEAIEDKEAEEGKQYALAISEAVKQPYYRIIKVAARMDNKAGAKIAKESESKGLVSLSELQSFAQACIGADPLWSRKASEFRSMLTARIATDIETGKEIGFSIDSSDTINLYRQARTDNKAVSNTKLTAMLKEVVNAMLPEQERKKAVHIADVRYMISASTGATKKLGELRVNKNNQFVDLLISVLARITGVTEGYSILA